MDIKISGVNADIGLELCDGSEKVYIRSLRLYVSNMPVYLEKIKNVSIETLHDYAINVHGVKSISEYIGAEETKKTARQLELMAKSGDLDGVLAANEAFIEDAQDLVVKILDWLEKNAA
jgi:HPt (histidine-containing phosphotransfer) domain-containing protein